ncbi:MAG TPA: HesA/MoeB/ThiF family protein [Planctomycetes bacterium]|nr:HesA/MoeB/ThiF family protein [Planctomycetota bacterium]HIK59589.1 HesA/MoeB/ThiF family protein [Planctomycetota bacterium]
MQPDQVPALSAHEREVYSWQLTVPGHGEAGQLALRGASVLVSRVGGLGSAVALELAAAGVGRLILAHAGDVQPSDLNRQLLMTHDSIGSPRIESVERRLKELNPRLETLCVAENIQADNVEKLVAECDLIVDCAPLFEERLLMNREAVRTQTPMVEAAMYELQAQLTTILPGMTPCLACITPHSPPAWKRRFPVFGAVSGSVGCMAAMEAIKVITGNGEPLAGRLLTYDLRDMSFRNLTIQRRPDCPVCGTTP